jgi:hypothetical protein
MVSGSSRPDLESSSSRASQNSRPGAMSPGLLSRFRARAAEQDRKASVSMFVGSEMT